MKKCFRFSLLFAIGCFSSISAFPQPSIPPGTPGWPVPAGSVNEQMRTENMKVERREGIEHPKPRPTRLDKASLKELENRRRVNDDDKLPYAEFLKTENAGIFKLFPDNGCIQKGLIRVDGDCTGFVPDSSFYSFRSGNYGAGGDIGYFKDHFVSRGFFSQSIMVSLGDVGIENVNEMHPAVKLLIDFRPHVTPASAARSVKLFANGVDADGYRFTGSLGSSTGPTFALRRIDFKSGGEDVKYRLTGSYEISLKNIFKFEDRKDTIYIFRVVRKDEDGAITIVWKQLSRKDAPTIVFKKGDKVPDLGKSANRLSDSELPKIKR